MAHRPFDNDSDLPLDHLLTRRRFLRGAGLVVAPSLLAACGDEDDEDPTPTAEAPATTPPAEPPASPAPASPVASPVASPGGEASQYRPTAVVASPEPQPVGEGTAEVGPAASPTGGDRLSTLLAASLQLVGGGELDEARGGQLLQLLDADPANRQSLDALLAAPAASPVARPESELRDQILRYWYLGTYDGQPVEDRAAFWTNLSSWQAVQYTSATSVCKGFGVWANPPDEPLAVRHSVVVLLTANG